MGKDRKPVGTLALVALAAILLSAVALAGDADAAKGGKGGGANNGSTATVWLEPAASTYPAYGYQFEVRGSGFNPNSAVYISLTPNGFTSNVGADNNGNIAFSWSTGAPGTYTFAAYQDFQGHRYTVNASVSFQVV